MFAVKVETTRGVTLHGTTDDLTMTRDSDYPGNDIYADSVNKHGVDGATCKIRIHRIEIDASIMPISIARKIKEDLEPLWGVYVEINSSKGDVGWMDRQEEYERGPDAN